MAGRRGAGPHRMAATSSAKAIRNDRISAVRRTRRTQCAGLVDSPQAADTVDTGAGIVSSAYPVVIRPLRPSLDVGPTKIAPDAWRLSTGPSEATLRWKWLVFSQLPLEPSEAALIGRSRRPECDKVAENPDGPEPPKGGRGEPRRSAPE